MKENEDQHHREERIIKMIIEMAGGNFTYQIPRTNQQNNIETIAVLLNMLAQELKDSYNPFVFNAPFDAPKIVEQYFFLLDQDLRVSITNAGQLFTPSFLKKPFQDLLSEDSQKAFQTKMDALARPEQKETENFQLALKTQLKLELPVCCTLFRMQQDPFSTTYLLVGSLVKTENALLEQEVNDPNQKQESSTSRLKTLKNIHDIKIIQQVREHILKNLHGPLETIPQIAHKYGTNEYKLKKGFKELYNITIGRFHLTERLRLARLIITNTDEKIKQISDNLGFKNYAHFSTAFKKQYGVSPFQVRKTTKRSPKTPEEESLPDSRI